MPPGAPLGPFPPPAAGTASAFAATFAWLPVQMKVRVWLSRWIPSDPYNRLFQTSCSETMMPFVLATKTKTHRQMRHTNCAGKQPPPLEQFDVIIDELSSSLPAANNGRSIGCKYLLTSVPAGKFVFRDNHILAVVSNQWAPAANLVVFPTKDEQHRHRRLRSSQTTVAAKLTQPTHVCRTSEFVNGGSSAAKGKGDAN